LHQQNDKYEPLPGLLSLPGFLYRKLGPGGRMAVKVGGGLFLVLMTVAAIVLGPRIAETNRERKANERRAAAEALAKMRRRITEEQRPHRARAGADAPRGAVLAELENRILADARARVAAGKLHGPAPKRVECELQTGADAGESRVPYDCTAVTSDLPSIDGSPGGVIGHPYRAVVRYPTGRLTWCKVSGRASSALPSNAVPRLPRACSR
jgi:hypothetical protein